jgi:protein archease
LRREISDMKKYEQIEHTADIGIRAFGGDLVELFTNAAGGMLELAFETESVSETETVKIELAGADIEELLVSWLQEILYYFEVKKIIPKKATVDMIEGNKLSAKVIGEKFNQDKHVAKREIKAVAYHMLKIEESNGVYSVQIIFDI